MIEERYIELIHAELDGALAPEERAELSRVLLANPEARAVRDELTRLFGALAQVENVAPPSELAQSVLHAIDLDAIHRPRPATRAGFLRSAGSSLPLLRYAAVFVGGLLASAVAFQLGSNGGTRPDASQLVGTIGGHEFAAPNALPDALIDRLELDLAQVSGSVSAYEVKSAVVVELALITHAPVEVVAVQGDRTVSFNLATRAGALPERLFWVPGDAVDAGSAIELKVFGSGTLLFADVLQTSRTH